MQNDNEKDFKTLSIRFPRYLYEKLLFISKSETRSIGQQVIHYLRKAVEAEEIIKVKEKTPETKERASPEKRVDGRAN
jgi:hypothetical protein